METTQRVMAAARSIRIKVTMESLFKMAVALAYPIGGLYGSYFSLKLMGFPEYANYCYLAAGALLGAGFLVETVMLGVMMGLVAVIVLFYVTAWVSYHTTTIIAMAFEAAWERRRA
jgi:hypothetical protein